MKRLACHLAALAMLSYTLADAQADTQADQQRAFNEGKAFKSANNAIKAGVNNAALANVPGQDANTTNQLKGLYGSNLAGAGTSKAAACATYTPGSDAYKNQECETINFVSGNPSQRPQYTIDKKYDPIVVRSSTIRNTPQNYTAGTSGLSGNYTACKDKTTNLPAVYDTERCQIGRPVTEGYCPVTRAVTYTWQLYTAQDGADIRYGKCGGNGVAQIRGDQLTLQDTNSYQNESAQCADQGFGDGTQTIIWAVDCHGVKTKHGFDASGCSKPPAPVASDPPRQAILSCTDAPRSIENCFTTEGKFTTKTTVPVFVDSFDDSACIELNANRAVITN